MPVELRVDIVGKTFMRNHFIAVVLATSLALASCERAPAPPRTATVLPDPNPVPEFALLDQHGSAIDESVFRGQWDLVFFGFTHCPDVCPTTMQVLAAAKAELAEQGQSPLPRIVLVSVDPERDTPEIMSQYVDYFGEGNLGITGTLEEIRKLTSGLGIYFQKQETGDEFYSVDHFTAVLVIDPDGGFSAVFGGTHKAENFVHDLPLLMVQP
jgi:protein SCO1/2